MKRARTNQGFLRLILIVVAIVLILGYFNIDIQKTVETPTNQKNISYVAKTAGSVWHNYLEKPVKYFWNNIFINLLWNTFAANMNRLRDGQPDYFQSHAPIIAPMPAAAQ